MINKLLFVTFFLFLQTIAMAEKDLPVDTFGSADMSKPIVLYISGDGGFNSFSTSFVQQWNSKGYPVIALNAKSYFWKTQTPENAAKDITDLLSRYLMLWKRNDVILVGYSLGADVLPFIQTRISAALINKIKHTVLLSPSNTTDFTVHLFYGSGGSSVPAEINKLNKPVLIIFGNDETSTPDKQINNKMVTILKVNGDHHYDNQIGGLVANILQRI